MGRRLGKACVANPIVCSGVVLGQIEGYDNMVGVIVDSFKFLTR